MSENIVDEDWEVDISIWVSTRKTVTEFEESLSNIIEPVVIKNRMFSIGAIEVQIKDVTDQPKRYKGIPENEYSFEIVVPTTAGLIWGCFDKKIVYALTMGLRSKFRCSYLVTTDSDDLIFYSGTNKPYFLNLNYLPCTNGELIPIFNDKSRVIELRL